MSYKNEVLSTPPTSFLTAPGVRDSILRFLSAATRENNVDNGWGCGAVGSAREWHSRGRRFNPGQLHQIEASLNPSRPFTLMFRIQPYNAEA